MKLSLHLVACVLLLLVGTAAKGQVVIAPISVEVLQRSEVTGRTGAPLGKAVVMEAKIVSGDILGDKSSRGSYYLDVHVVDGTKLPKHIVIGFNAEARGNFDLPNDSFALYKFKNKRDATRLSDDETRELEKGFVGKHVKLWAYETGYYSGIPNNLPKGYPVGQGRRFGFSTYLVVLGEYKSPTGKAAEPTAAPDRDGE